MKVQFVMNVPETLALQDPSGLYNVEYEEVSYPTVDGRILTLPVLAAERLNALFLRPGETFTVCRQWSKEKGTIPHFVFCLTAASEQRRAAEESAQPERPRQAKHGGLRRCRRPQAPNINRNSGTVAPERMDRLRARRSKPLGRNGYRTTLPSGKSSSS